MDSRERLAALQSARRGDAEALGRLLDGFRPYVRVIVHGLRDRRVQGRADESDFVQDALLEAHRSFGSFKGETVAELVVWLRQIVVRTTGRTLRGLIGTARRDPTPEEPALLDCLAAPDSSPPEQAIHHEEALSMAEALGQLPDDMQRVLLGRHVDGLSHADIARSLGRTEGAVRML